MLFLRDFSVTVRDPIFTPLSVSNTCRPSITSRWWNIFVNITIKPLDKDLLKNVKANLWGNSQILSISCSISSRPVSYSRLLTNDVNINTDMGENFQQRMGCLQQHFTGPSVTCFGYLRGSAFIASLPLTGPPFVRSCIFTIKWPPCRRNLRDARYKEFWEVKILRNVIPVNFQLYRGPYSTSAMFSRFRSIETLITCRTRIFIQEKKWNFCGKNSNFLWEKLRH